MGIPGVRKREKAHRRQRVSVQEGEDRLPEEGPGCAWLSVLCYVGYNLGPQVFWANTLYHSTKFPVSA